MTALADYTAYLNAVKAASLMRRYKNIAATNTGVTNGPWASSWRQTPDAGANPTVVDNALSGSSVGALFAAPAVSGVPRLAQVEGCVAIDGVVLLCDRLAQTGGLVGNVATAQNATTNATQLPVGPNASRYSSGDGVKVAVEIFTQIGTTATTLTLTYTNQAGTSGRTTVPIAIGATNFREQTRFFECPLQAGDTGVRSVEALTLAATTGTAGSIGIVLYKPLCFLGSPLKGGQFLWDAIHGGCANMPDLTGICPMLLSYYSAGGNGDGVFDFRIIDA